MKRIIGVLLAAVVLTGGVSGCDKKCEPKQIGPHIYCMKPKEGQQ